MEGINTTIVEKFNSLLCLLKEIVEENCQTKEKIECLTLAFKEMRLLCTDSINQVMF